MEKGNSSVLAVVVVVVIVLVAWLAYRQGYIGGTQDNEQDIEINLPGGSQAPEDGGY